MTVMVSVKVEDCMECPKKDFAMSDRGFNYDICREAGRILSDGESNYYHGIPSWCPHKVDGEYHA